MRLMFGSVEGSGTARRNAGTCRGSRVGRVHSCSQTKHSGVLAASNRPSKNQPKGRALDPVAGGLCSGTGKGTNSERDRLALLEAPAAHGLRLPEHHLLKPRRRDAGAA